MANERDPKLGQSGASLQHGADLACYLLPPADATTLPAPDTPLNRAKAAGRAVYNAANARPPSNTCQQVLWLSFFFDGTGNNLDADAGTFEHSNVARMFRAMPRDNPDQGLHSYYIPGIGTYFKDIGDPGGTVTGRAFAARGQERLDWAWQRFDERLRAADARAHNPTNRIVAIHVSVFGFSRGAALARAFVRDLARRCEPAAGGWRLRSNQAPLRVRFVGLWDTVASVGLPMGAVGTLRLLRPDPVELAFGRPGADPAATSPFDGHGAWGDGLEIPELVEQCVHHVAAHEVRNSFPLDSVMRNGVKPANCKEVVYPGVHSNVGGGYRPGEGARSLQSAQLLSLLPLKAMYDEAMKAGVPLLTASSRGWKEDNTKDFQVDQTLLTRFTHYMRHIGPGTRPLGELFNAHNAMYYAWRFRHIRQKQAVHAQPLGRGHQLTTEERGIAAADYRHKQDAKALQAEIERIEREDGPAIAAAQRRVQQAEAARLAYLQSRYADPQARQGLKAHDEKVAAAQNDLAEARDRLMRAKARRDTLPAHGQLIGALNRFDEELLEAAETMVRSLQANPRLRSQLRPHYKGLVEAYENEFLHGRGLADPELIAFFETYVHDSLAGFDTDGTAPSDPRVVYVGRDVKLRFAEAPARPDAHADSVVT